MTAPTSSNDGGRLPDWARPFLVVVGLVAAMWVVQIVDLLPRIDLLRFGIRPRRLVGLRGIVLGPFLHTGFRHLVSNTIPFLILGWVVAASGTVRYLQVTVLIALSSGLGVWLLSPSRSLVIGASGLVFGYLTYLIARAIFEVKIAYLIGGALVLMLYGGVLWGLVPRPGISWQGHVFGALGGVVAARVLHSPGERTLPDDSDPLAPNLP